VDLDLQVGPAQCEFGGERALGAGGVLVPVQLALVLFLVVSGLLLPVQVCSVAFALIRLLLVTTYVGGLGLVVVRLGRG